MSDWMTEIMAVTRKEWKIGKQEELVEVPHPDDMDDETFLKHIEARHATECRIEGYISRHAVEAWIDTYRVFHDRLHKIETPGQYSHVHADEEDE